MDVRYFTDPETGLPHIYGHGVTEVESEWILAHPGEDEVYSGGSRQALGQSQAGRYLRVVYVPDESGDGVLVVTAYPLAVNNSKRFGGEGGGVEQETTTIPRLVGRRQARSTITSFALLTERSLVTPQQTADSTQPGPTRNDLRVKWVRYLLGFVAGAWACGLVGWLIDSASTSEPYAGVRIGSLVGGLCGGVVCGGAGWKGLGIVFSMLLCSAGGAGLGLALWNPGPNSFLMFIPAGVGGIVGAFTGLAAAAALINKRHSRSPVTPSDNSEESHSQTDTQNKAVNPRGGSGGF